MRTLSSFLLLALAGAVLVLEGVFAQPPEPKKYALLIGINKYNHADMNKPSPLQYAEADIAAAKALFETSGYEVEVLTGEKATLEAIRAGLKRLAKKGSSDGVVVVGLSGHGVQPDGGPEAYYCPFDTAMRLAMRDGKPVLKDGKPVTEADPETMLPLTEVLTALKLSPAGSRLMIADCCRNDKASGKGVGTGLTLGDLPDKTAVLLACSRGQQAYEDQAWGGGHGAFFHFALEGMKTQADNEGRVLGSRLAEYLEDVVPAEVARVKKGGAEQKPFWLVSGRVDLQLSRRGPKAGEEREFEVAAGVKMRFCWVPPSPGKVQLGSPKAEQDYLTKTFFDGKRPDWLDTETEGARGLFATKGFWLGKYEVTQGEWTAAMGSNPSDFDGKRDNAAKGLETARYPVENVSWDDCQKFIDKANAHASGKVGRYGLPHEDEWEYACRGGKGNGRAFYWGDDLNGDKANCDGNYPYGGAAKGTYLKRPTTVGSYQKEAPHPWGLCDMHGNVWEWCENLYSSGGSFRVFRGGSWLSDARGCRSAFRDRDSPVYRFNFLGFRLALVPSVR
jgi:formylglycine-generating enzyme required for sulfatase activity